MNRRDTVLALLALGAAPLASFAQQQGKVWRVGFLSTRHRPDSIDADYYGAFQKGLRELGFVEGKNLIIEWRFADASYERLPALAQELVKLNVDAIVAPGPQGIVAARNATATIPIVITSAIDPVEAGWVKSLAHPGGNVTGLSNLGGEVGPKHLEMLQAMVPKLTRVAVLVNPANSGRAALLKAVNAVAGKANVEVLRVEAQSPRGIESEFSTMVKEKAGAVIVALDALFIQQRRQIAELAAKNRLPSISTFREYAEDGGLMSYGQNITDQFRLIAGIVGKILKGAKPSDLPVEQSTQLELFINRKAAKALGLKIPQAILARADRVIE